MDNKDQQSLHLMLQDKGLKGYARLVPPGISYAEMSIGRVVTHPSVRGTGVGKVLMQQAIDLCHRHFGKGSIKIGAQCYAKKFYEQLGFIQSSAIYDEDGIPHIEMIKD